MKLLSIFMFLLLTGTALADNHNMYSDAELTTWKNKIEANIQWYFSDHILANMSPAERRNMGHAKLSLPLRAPGKKANAPLAFYSYTGNVVAPAKSILFFNDISIAMAYYYLNGGDIQTVYDYMAMMKYRRAEDMEGGKFLPPLEALGVPAEIWKKDTNVDDLSQKILKSAIMWILAHETGHCLYHHQGYDGISAKEAQVHETEADLFANEILRRIGMVPAGMANFFMLMLHSASTSADFANKNEWLKNQAEHATHPFTGTRMQLLAEDLKRTPRDFTHGEDNRSAATESVKYVADQIASIAKMLEDTDIVEGIRLKGLTTDHHSLQKNWLHKPSISDGIPPTGFKGKYSGNMSHIYGENEETFPVEMVFTQQGKQIKGMCYFGLGTMQLSGFTTNDTLNFEWRFGSDTGMGILEVTEKERLTGTWGYGDSLNNAGTLNLERIQ